MTARKVLIGPSSFAAADISPLDKLRKAGFEVSRNPFGRKLTREELMSLLAGMDGLIAGLETIDGHVMENSVLKVISRCGAGMDNVDLQGARRRGIKVFSTPDAPTSAVAELTVAAMISLLRDIPGANEAVHNGRWPKKAGVQLEGLTVAIIGFGRIGRKVAALLKPFGAVIVAVDPDYGGGVDGIEALALHEALARSDLVTIHASGEKTLLGEEEFRVMKKGAYLLNCARGGLLDEGPLADALDSGRIAGAWLDCFSEEPYGGPLKKYHQVILTPHIGSYTTRCRSRMETEAVDNLIKGFQELESTGG